MRAQKLKTFGDFLKRAEIIPQSLLVLTNDSADCSEAILELKALNYDVPFYEINLSENPDLMTELSHLYGPFEFPTLLYFRGKVMIRKKIIYKQTQDFSSFLKEAVNLDY